MKGVMINENYELWISPIRKDGLIQSGLVIDNIDYQRCMLIIEMQKGELKEHPTLGFGIENYLRSVSISTRQRFIAELQNELKSDGIADAKITVGSDLSTFEIEL